MRLHGAVGRNLTLGLLLTGVAVHAQMQLPPGTSSSVDPAEQSAAADPDLAKLQAAEKQMSLQIWPAAVAILRPMVEHSPKNAHAWYDLGFSLDAMNDDAGAKTAYEHATAADARYLAPRASLGLLLARGGDLAAAEAMLRSSVALEGDANAKAVALRALARIDADKQPERARDELVAAIQLSREGPADVVLTGEIAEAMHDDASAEAAYARAMRTDAGDVEVEGHYARVLTREGKFDAARSVLAAGLKEHPQDRGLLSERAGLLVREKNFVEAVPALEALHAGMPADTAVTRLLARAYVAAGTPAKADPLFQVLADADKMDGELLSEWGDSLIRQKRNAEAEAVLQRALLARFETKEAKADAAGELAFAASVNGQPEEVLRAVSIRDDISPIDATSAFLLATAHDTFHHTREAAGFYRQFIQLSNGKFPDEEWQAKQRLQILSRAK